MGVEISTPILIRKKMKRPDIFKMIADVAKEENYALVPEFAYAQFVHETGNFTSPLFKEGNNVSGMKPSSRALHNGVYTNGEGSATYKDIRTSVLDYVRRLKQTILGEPPVVPYKDAVQFYNELIRTRYAEDAEYMDKVMAIYMREFPNGSTTGSKVIKSISKIAKGSLWAIGAVVLAIPFAVYFIVKKFK